MNIEKWEKIPFELQMGNIGSEINRVILWDESGDRKGKENALWRALELLDLTISQRRSWELLRLKEIVCDKFLGENSYKVSSKFLKNYFLDFALLSSKI
jgi:hypothetical protein